MHTDENNAIRYLMKEMDPSEEMEFEKKMRENENLLIEVESLRVTNKKLSGLPQKNPPKDLVEQISEDAKHLRSKNRGHNYNPAFLIKRGIAAAVLLTVFTGGFYYYSVIPDTQQPSSVESEMVEPWVDRNEVIRFSEGGQTIQSSSNQTDFTKSYEKLQLVSDPRGNNTTGSGILLTGSPK